PWSRHRGWRPARGLRAWRRRRGRRRRGRCALTGTPDCRWPSPSPRPRPPGPRRLARRPPPGPPSAVPASSGPASAGRSCPAAWATRALLLLDDLLLVDYFGALERLHHVVDG